MRGGRGGAQPADRRHAGRQVMLSTATAGRFTCSQENSGSGLEFYTSGEQVIPRDGERVSWQERHHWLSLYAASIQQHGLKWEVHTKFSKSVKT